MIDISTSTTPPTTRVAFVGAGNIAGPYAASLATHPDLQLIGVFDLDVAKRDVFARETGCPAFASLDELEATQPDIVVNLTSAPHHFASTAELIERGLSVFSEKPLALVPAEAQQLVEASKSRSVRLACAPSLWLGDASLEAARRVRRGALGEVRLVTAEVNQGRIESWHPAPHHFYAVGPVVDAGVYPLTYLTAVLGPVREVRATSSELLRDRTTLAGEEFQPPTPDGWVAVVRFESGALLRLTCTFFIDNATVPRSIDFHGTRGSLRLQDWLRADSAVWEAPYGQPFTISRPGEGVADIDWCLGLADLAQALREGRSSSLTAPHAAHVVEVLAAVAESATTGGAVSVTSTFPVPHILTAPADTSPH